jgi:hypothetical protein
MHLHPFSEPRGSTQDSSLCLSVAFDAVLRRGPFRSAAGLIIASFSIIDGKPRKVFDDANVVIQQLYTVISQDRERARVLHEAANMFETMLQADTFIRWESNAKASAWMDPKTSRPEGSLLSPDSFQADELGLVQPDHDK